MIAGPADTGKTWGACRKLHRHLMENPGAQAVILRKTLNSLYTTIFQTWRRVTADAGLMPFGGQKPEWEDYPNGSRVYFAGMDNPQKALSSERDYIYTNQTEEFLLDDWQTLTTRCNGRAGNAPNPQIFGDCNPGPPNHWIKQRASLQVLESRHEDNPTIYDTNGSILETGRMRMAVLDALIGMPYKRLRLGQWVAAEGAVYEEWDEAIHRPYRFEVPKDWTRYWVIDFGYTNPFVWQQWAVSPDGDLYREIEIYMTRRIVKDHCRTIFDATRGYPFPEEIICDHDAEDRATFEREMRDLYLAQGTHRLVQTTAAHKEITPGIQAVQTRLRKQMRGSGQEKPRIFFLRDALLERDEELSGKRKPVCTEDEFGVYVWPKGVDGKPIKEVPVDLDNHGMDATRYMVARLDVAARRAGTWA